MADVNLATSAIGATKKALDNSATDADILRVAKASELDLDCSRIADNEFSSSSFLLTSITSNFIGPELRHFKLIGRL